MAQSSLVEIRRKLGQSRRKTMQLIRTIDEQTADFQPRPYAWSIKQHVVHLIAVEESIIHFAHRILQEDCPISPLCYDLAFDRDAWNVHEVSERAGYSWPETISALEQVHLRLLELLARVSEENLTRVGTHPVWGEPVTLASILRTPYRHERGHQEEIAILSDLVHKLYSDD